MITEIIEYKLKESTNEECFLAEAQRYHAYFKATFLNRYTVSAVLL